MGDDVRIHKLAEIFYRVRQRSRCLQLTTYFYTFLHKTTTKNFSLQGSMRFLWLSFYTKNKKKHASVSLQGSMRFLWLSSNYAYRDLGDFCEHPQFNILDFDIFSFNHQCFLNFELFSCNDS